MARFRTEWVHTLRAAEAAAFRRLLPPPGDAIRGLEIGAGDGFMAARLAEHGYRIVATDPSPRRPHYVEIKEACAESLPFPDAAFDFVYSSNVLEHIPDLTAVLAEMRRVLKPGGMAVHSVPSTACSVMTTLTQPLAYVRNLGLLMSGYFFRDIDLERPFGRAGLDRLVSTGGARAMLRRAVIGAVQVNPLRLVRLGGHGAARNSLAEALSWRVAAWRARFSAAGFDVVECRRGRYFATMNKLLGARCLGLRARAARLGAANVNIFLLRSAAQNTAGRGRGTACRGTKNRS